MTKARAIAASTNGANAVGGSSLATEDFITSVTGPQELYRNPYKFNSSPLGATVAASNSLMGSWTSNRNLLVVGQDYVVGKKLYTSPFAVNYSRTFMGALPQLNASNWEVWVPRLEQLPNIDRADQTDFAINDDESILLYLGAGLGGNGNCLRRSTDKGKTFSAAVPINPNFTGVVRAIEFGAGVFVAVGDSSHIWTSTDGITWTQINLGSVGGFQKIRYKNGVFVAATSTSVFTSTNGLNWTNRASALSNVVLSLNHVGANSWVIGYNTSSYYFSSNNGTSWISRNLPAGYTQMTSAEGDGTGYVLAGGNVGNLMYSLDYGSTFTNLGALTDLSGNVHVVFYGGFFWVRSSSNSNSIVSISPQPKASTLGTDFVSTTSVYLTKNGYNMVGEGISHPGELQVVKGDRLFIRGAIRSYMTHRGQ